MLPLVGVEAIVEGLSGFVSDIGAINASVKGLGDDINQYLGNNAISGAIDWITNAFGNLGREILNVAEVALGTMLRDAIEWAITQLGNLVGTAYDAATAFQVLEIRLQGINLQDGIDSGLSYTDAMAQAVQVTKEQLDWIQLLAVATPFTISDISNIYVLARNYGFADDEAKKLVMSVNDFTAGMGLTGTAAESVIQNFGRMISRGKITTQVMTYMARGAFVPLADIEKRMADNMGITTEELVKQIGTLEGIPADEFVKAFEQMTSGEERFIGASGRLGKTFLAAGENIVDFIARSVIGKQIILPILDMLGARMSSLVDQFVSFNTAGEITKTDKWDKIIDIATRIGAAFSDIVTQIFNFLPSAGSLADTIISVFDSIATWLETHKDDVVSFFMSIVAAIKDIALWITKNVVPAFDTISKWVGDNGPLIQEFFSTLVGIIGDVLQSLLGVGTELNGESGLMGFLDALKNVMQWIIDNRESITNFVIAITNMWLGMELIKFSLLTIFDILGWAWANPFDALQLGLELFVGLLAATATNMIEFMARIFGTGNPEKMSPWEELGRNAMQGIINGLWSMAQDLDSALYWLMSNALAWAMDVWSEHSPSKEFEKIGMMGIQGLIEGINNMGSAVNSSIGNVMGGALGAGYSGATAAASTVSNSVSTTNNFSLAINSNANSEPIISDFKTLSAMTG